MALIPALGRLRQESPQVRGQPGLHREFEASLLHRRILSQKTQKNEIYTYNGILVGYNNEISVHATTWMNLENYIIMFEFPYMRYLE